MNFTDLGKGGEIIEAPAKMYVQWVDAIKEVTEGVEHQNWEKKKAQKAVRGTYLFKIVHMALICSSQNNPGFLGYN